MFVKIIFMRKILLAFDGSHFSEGAFEFARRLNEVNPILLTGAFLPQVSYANIWSYADGIGGPIFLPVQEDEVTEEINKNIEKFNSLCVKHNNEHSVRKDLTDLALPELKKESRFADLLIIGGESFYENAGSGDPNNYLKDALHEMECAVMVVPEKYDFPTLNILTYNGSPSSVYAIKQFTYLFPEFAANKTLLIYAKDEEGISIPDEAYVEELVSRHFSDLTVTKLNIDPKERFVKWLNNNTSAVLICGAYGRSIVSQLFKKSFIADVLSEHKFPVFITHN